MSIPLLPVCKDDGRRSVLMLGDFKSLLNLLMVVSFVIVNIYGESCLLGKNFTQEE